jgi:hypothetical protein
MGDYRVRRCTRSTRGLAGYPWAPLSPSSRMPRARSRSSPATDAREIFKGVRKRMTDIGAGLSKLRQFHDGKNVTADSFRLSAILAGKTLIFAGYRKKSREKAAPDTGSSRSTRRAPRCWSRSGSRVGRARHPSRRPPRRTEEERRRGGPRRRHTPQARRSMAHHHSGRECVPVVLGIADRRTVRDHERPAVRARQNCTGKFCRSIPLQRDTARGAKHGAATTTCG